MSKCYGIRISSSDDGIHGGPSLYEKKNESQVSHAHELVVHNMLFDQDYGYQNYKIGSFSDNKLLLEVRKHHMTVHNEYKMYLFWRYTIWPASQTVDQMQ